MFATASVPSGFVVNTRDESAMAARRAIKHDDMKAETLLIRA